jgi:SAM-dependent methyltransferase
MITVGRRAYNLMYRFGAPWEGADRVELRALVRDGRCAPATLRRPGTPAARAIDLGCGAGGVSVELAAAGFEVTGVDFSPVALRKARAAARRHGLGPDHLRFLQADLTAGSIPGVDGPFDLLVDYGTLDDLPPPARRSMAALVARLARPGARFFLYAFAGRLEDLPRLSFSGPSRAFPGIDNHEVEALFGEAFRIEVLDAPTRTRHIGTWLLERKEDGMQTSTGISTRPAAGAVTMAASGTASEIAAVPGARFAGYSLLVSAVAAAAGIMFLVAMFSAFGAGARAWGMRFGWMNDTLVLVSYLLALPSVLVLHRLLSRRYPVASTIAALTGTIGIAVVVVFQGLLVAGVLTFEQQIGPALIGFLVVMGWFIATGYLGSRDGVIPRGTRLGILGASYIGFPVWAVALGRRLLGR